MQDIKFPMRITLAPNMGRQVVAARPLEPGELILRESPLGWSIDAELVNHYCAGCASDLTGVTPSGGCNACGARYCSARCELAGSVAHSVECDGRAALPKISADTGVGVDLLRLALALCSAERFAQGTLAPDAVLAEREEIERLEAPLERYPWNIRQAIEAATQALSEAVSHAYTPEALAQSCARVSANSFQLGQDADVSERIGHAVGPRSAMFNHSCFPNAAMVNRGAVLEVRARRPIAEGEAITLTYVGLYETRETRRETLRQQRFFECGCVRCTGEAETDVDKAAYEADRAVSGVRCLVEDCRGLMGPPGEAVQTCWDCGTEQPLEALQAAAAPVLAELSASVAAINDTRVDIAQRRARVEAAISAAQERLPDEHAAIFGALPALVMLLGEQGDYGARVARARQLVHCITKGMPKHSVSAEACYLLLAESLLLFNAAYSPGLEALAQLARELLWALRTRGEIFAVCCGPEHPATRSAVAVLASIQEQLEPSQPTD